MRSSAHRVHDQIQVAIAIQIGKGGSGGVQARTSHTGLVGDVLKLPIAQIPKQRIGTIQPTEVKIHQTVAVHIPRRHAGTVQVNLVGDVTFNGEVVGKGNSCGRGRQLDETRFAG